MKAGKGALQTFADGGDFFELFFPEDTIQVSQALSIQIEFFKLNS